ncbi:MAG: adenylyl-sulfate kinase [Marinilabiliales bacterium]
MKKTKTDPTLWTDFNAFIRRNRKRFLVRQTPHVIWLTGLSGAGKTTLARALEKEILRRGFFTKYFDGDVIRKGLNKDLGFSIEDRIENIRRIAELTKIFLDSGIIVIVGFITPTEQMRELAKSIVGYNRFIEIYVNAPLEVCEQRDVKGLYAKARRGEIKNFTGIDSVFEPPANPDVEVRTDLWSLKKCTKVVLDYVLPKIKFNKSLPLL